jgi:hypothetical protein
VCFPQYRYIPESFSFVGDSLVVPAGIFPRGSRTGENSFFSLSFGTSLTGLLPSSDFFSLTFRLVVTFGFPVVTDFLLEFAARVGLSAAEVLVVVEAESDFGTVVLGPVVLEVAGFGALSLIFLLFFYGEKSII